MSEAYTETGIDRECKSCGATVFIPIRNGYVAHYDYCPFCGEDFEVDA